MVPKNYGFLESTQIVITNIVCPSPKNYTHGWSMTVLWAVEEHLPLLDQKKRLKEYLAMQKNPSRQGVLGNIDQTLRETIRTQIKQSKAITEDQIQIILQELSG